MFQTRLRIVRCVNHALAASLALVLFACGGSATDEAPPATAPTASTAGATEADTTSTPTDVTADATCSLLTNEEVTAVLGEHKAGEADLAYGGCFWPAVNPDDPASGIHVTVLDTPSFESLATIGLPVEEFGGDATYDDIHREFWFTCGDQHCGVIAVFDPAEEARQAALDLARIVRDRVGG